MNRKMSLEKETGEDVCHSDLYLFQVWNIKNRNWLRKRTLCYIPK